MEEKLYIRKIEMNDYDQYIPLLQELSNIPYISFDEYKCKLKNIENQGTSIFIIENTNKILLATGSLLVEQRFGDPLGHIENVVVKKEFRKQGLGKMIVQHIIDEAKKEKCYRITLSCNDNNTRFYENIGMIQSGNEMRKMLK